MAPAQFPAVVIPYRVTMLLGEAEIGPVIPAFLTPIFPAILIAVTVLVPPIPLGTGIGVPVLHGDFLLAGSRPFRAKEEQIQLV